VCHISYHLSCERLHMAELDDYIILQPGHYSFSIQNVIISRLRMFNCQATCHAIDAT
jgi:hypothetical protein